jgi:hypothetical protein
MTEREASDWLIAKLLDAKHRESWRFEFRASGLPACQLKYMWWRLDDKLDELPRRKRSYFGDFFTEIGTAVHSATQRWLGRLGVLYGPWRCPVCDTVKEPHLGTVWCEGTAEAPHRSVECVYEEFAFDEQPSGHCDGLLKMRDLTPEPNDYVVLEVKTTSEKKLDEVVKVEGPPLNYMLQATNYAYRFKQRGLNIVAVMFLFIPRESPRRMHPLWVHPRRVARINQQIVDDHNAAIGALDTGDCSGLRGICATPADGQDCPYHVSCFSPIADTLFDDKAKRVYTASTKPPVWPGAKPIVGLDRSSAPHTDCDHADDTVR